MSMPSPQIEALIDTLKGDEKTGAMIIAKALQAPIRQIAENAGVDGSVIFEKIRNSGKIGYGYNAYTEEYCDMIPSGIVDPTKVTRSALENAASICACVLTTESLVTDKPDPLATQPRQPLPQTQPAWAVCIDSQTPKNYNTPPGACTTRYTPQDFVCCRLWHNIFF